MGLLLLLTSMLLSSDVWSLRGVDAQSLFAIRSISLSLEPGEDVTRDTNVTVRCTAVVSTSGLQPLSREYNISKDGTTIYSKTTSSEEDLLYPLPHVRVSHTGKYMCKISIEGKSQKSEVRRLRVTGLSPPVLQVEKTMLSEGEELKASCTAPGETGVIMFYFYEDGKEKQEERVKTDHVEVAFPLSGPGHHTIECSYRVLLTPDSILSEKSHSVRISVRELPFVPVLDIFPQYEVYEGDQLSISCGVQDTYHHFTSVSVYLSQGTNLLQHGQTKVNHTMKVLARDAAEFECRLAAGKVEKAVTKAVPVTELFSVPTLTMTPVEVFQKELMKLICKSDEVASKRLSSEDLTYSIDPHQMHLVEKDRGVFSGKALAVEFNYSCRARAKNIEKQSRILTVRPKVAVSVPKISVVDRAIIGKPFKIRCKSDNGSLPINYTLMFKYEVVAMVTVKVPSEEALFNVTVYKSEDINKFICEATNRRSGLGPLSGNLDATVIEPLSLPLLTVIPPPPEITEGSNLIFICSIRGTPPVTFKVYRSGYDLPLFTKTSAENNTSFEIHGLVKDHSGTYYFEALNHANNIVRSNSIKIEVRLAMWKKLVIGSFCLLALCVLVVVCVLCYKTQRGKKKGASELSVKPAYPKSDETLTMNLTHETPVYDTPTDAVPGYEGIEGRVTNGTRASVASLPPNTSYSVSAAV
ncbi:platelet endothelial cell adhesion molecule isoform X3 [Boleophthalmus pectinirostris]|uniref:platelet endothelial cell adhesion molecule isoform X3 n=1 Tax=Boleophthalmus pectinirostris TaxID=150288 RepID=UPI000A1C2108|nr:platelet endothelial cell adhesion molecule isoform X3 [Boleophthalmus pectinirostris]